MKPVEPVPTLPVEAVIPALRSALNDNPSVVLQAPPGAGKTTRVPLALLDEDWLGGRRIIMLQPRRLAARAAAGWMARLLGQNTGDTVGYRVRSDTRVSARTRIEVVTEGVLTRILQNDPGLEEYGLVIFDEFHERSLHADLGLAFTLQSRELLRPDLRVLIMSATLDAAPVAQLLDDAPTVTSTGRSFPVETRYLSRPRDVRIESLTARTVLRALDTETGDVLVFLPGAGEIRRTYEELANEIDAGIRVYQLYGNLPAVEQDAAIAPSPPGTRKVVLATSIAETSLTIEGVRVVVDSGVMRVPRFSPRTGMTRLDTLTVTAASAEQRRGRAGRVAPGVCYRLWTEAEQAALRPHGVPEILEADLAPLALELAIRGVADPAELRWLDAPAQGAFSQARELLAELGAIEPHGTATPHGRAIAEIPLHPRLAHMVVRGTELGAGSLACDIAALLEERDLLRGATVADSDIRLRIDALRGRRTASVDRATLQRVRQEADRLRGIIGIANSRQPMQDNPGLLLALAYPDRIALRRPGRVPRFILRNGRGASLPEGQILSTAEYIVAAVLDDAGTESRIFIGGEIDFADIERHFADQILTTTDVLFDENRQAVTATRRRTLGAIVLNEAVLSNVDAETIASALLEHVRRRGTQVLPWTRDTTQLRQRLAFMHGVDAAWPDPGEAALIATLDEWLAPFLPTANGRINYVDTREALLSLLSWEQRSRLDTFAPTHMVVPTGSRIPIDYSDPEAPALAVRLQEIFDWKTTPLLAGKVPLTLHLLSPARRPVQITRDLASFWEKGYFEVRKELKGRYPKHAWP